MQCCSISRRTSTAASAPRSELWRTCWVKNLWRRNNESGTQDRFQDAISFARFVLLDFNENTGANVFAVACAVGNTGRSGESVCAATGGAATRRHDRL